MSTASYDDVLRGARRLSLAERLRLAGALVNEAASELRTPSEQPPMTPTEALAALDEVRAHFAAQGPVTLTIADELTDSRR